MTAQEEERIKKDERAMAVLRHEPYEIELGVVAQVTTYYMLAARRFHDSVCMRIDSKFFKQLRTQLRDELENGLGLNDSSEGQYLQFSPHSILLTPRQDTATPFISSLSRPTAIISVESSLDSATRFFKAKIFSRISSRRSMLATTVPQY